MNLHLRIYFYWHSINMQPFESRYLLYNSYGSNHCTVVANHSSKKTRTMGGPHNRVRQNETRAIPYPKMPPILLETHISLHACYSNKTPHPVGIDDPLLPTPSSNAHRFHVSPPDDTSERETGSNDKRGTSDSTCVPLNPPTQNLDVIPAKDHPSTPPCRLPSCVHHRIILGRVPTSGLEKVKVRLNQSIMACGTRPLRCRVKTITVVPTAFVIIKMRIRMPP